MKSLYFVTLIQNYQIRTNLIKFLSRIGSTGERTEDFLNSARSANRCATEFVEYIKFLRISLAGGRNDDILVVDSSFL